MSTVVTSLSVNITANVSDVTEKIKKLNADLNELIVKQPSVTLHLDMQFKQGTAQKLARATKAICSTLSQNAVVNVDLRLKQGAAGSLRNAVRSAASNMVTVPVSAGPAAPTSTTPRSTPARPTFTVANQQLEFQQGKNLAAQWAKEIDASMKQAGRAVDRFGNESAVSLEKTNSWFDKTRRTILAFATGYLVIQGATKIIHELNEAVFGFNQTIDSARIGFESLVGSKSGADNLIRQMQTLAELTPFEFKDLLPFSQQLLMAGRHAKSLIVDMRAIGDHVARIGGGKEYIDRIVYALNQISTAGKVAGTEIRQLTEARVPAVKILAESWGVTTEKMQEFIKEGVIPADKAVDALIKGMGRDAFGYMAKQAKTFQGALSNVRDIFQRVIGQAARPHFDKLTRSLNDLVDVIQKPAFQQWATQTMSHVFGALETLGQMIGWLFRQFNEKWPYILAALGAIGAAKIVAGIQATTTAIKALAVGTAVAGATAGFAIAAWAAAIIALVAVYRNFNIVQEITSNVAEVVLTSFKLIGHAISWLLGQVSAFLQKVPDTVLLLNGPLGAAALAFKRTLGDMTNVEVDSDKFWDGLIADFHRGKAKFDRFISSDLSGIIGFDPKKPMYGEVFGPPSPRPTLPDYSGQFRPGKEDGKAEAARLKRLKDFLGDSADAWRKYANAVEDSTKKIIDRMADMQKSIAGVFDRIKADLVSKGIIDDPLGGAINALGNLLRLGDRQKAVATRATNEIRNALGEAKKLDEAKERAEGKDGIVGSGPLAPMPVSRLKQVKGVRQAPPQYNGQSTTQAAPFEETIRTASNALSEMRKIRAGWGEAVRDIEGNAIRFQLQSYLVTKEGAEMLADVLARLEGEGGAEALADIGKKLGISFDLSNFKGLDKAAAFVRQFANALDVKANRAQLPGLLRELNEETGKFLREQRDLRDVQKATMAFVAGNGFDPIQIEKYTRLLEQQKKIDELRNDRSLIPLETRQGDLRNRFNIENAAADAKRLTEAFLESEKAIRDAKREMAGLNDETVQQIAHRRVFGAENAALLLDTQKLKQVATEVALELGKLDREHTLRLRELGDEMKLVVHENELIAQGLTDSRISERLQFHTDLITKQNQLTRNGVEVMKAFGMAAEQAHGARQIRSQRELNAAYREQNQIIRDTTRDVALQGQLQAVIMNTATGSFARERGMAVENKLDELRKKYEGKAFAGTSISTELVEWVRGIEAGTLTRALEVYKQQTDEAADASRLFADMSGMVAVALKLEREVTTSLDAAKKAELLTTAAGVLGLQRYAAERDALFSQQFSLMQELETRRASMMRNLTGLQQEELKWKYEDLEADQRLLTLNAEQRREYDKQRPAVLKLRDAVRSLFSEMDALKYEEWGRAFNERFAELTSGLGSLAGLRTQLRRDQFSDADIADILNRERWLGMAEMIAGGVSDTFSGLFDGIMNHSESLFDDLLQNVKKTMQQITMEILMSQVHQWIGKVIGTLGGSIAAGGSQTSSSGPVDFPMEDNAGYMATISRGMARRDPGLVNGLAASGGGGGQQVVVQQYYVDKIVANDPGEFRKRLPGQESSRSMMNRQVARTLGGVGAAA